MKILEDNKDTEYGKKYDFANIKTIKDYQEKVPITTYDDYAEYIYRMTEKGEDNLITVYDVNHYAKSSGTMGNPKRIPVSILSEQNFSKYVTAYNLYMMYNELGGEWINYPVLNLVELSLSKLKNGADYSSISGKIIKEYDENLSEIMTSPIEAIMPQIETDTRYLHARFALTQEISYVFTSFVSLFLESLRYIVANWELLADDIEKGTIHESIKMTEEVRNSLLKKIKPMPERANHIRKAFQDESDKAIVPKIWPELCCLSGVGTEDLLII